VPSAGRVEPDAASPTFPHTIQDMAQTGSEPRPRWRMLVGSGPLASNLTVAGAPALSVPHSLGEKEEGRKVSLREFLSWSIPFTILCSLVCYVLGMLIWVLPYTS
jgi:Na+/H+ antiporter NhaD/arsenite permease-like protein